MAVLILDCRFKGNGGQQLKLVSLDNMTTRTLHDSILDALAGSSSQMPVDLSTLHSLIRPKVKLSELTAELDAICANRELQTCNGIKDGKAYVCYWLSGNLPPPWNASRNVAAAIPKPVTGSKRKK